MQKLNKLDNYHFLLLNAIVVDNDEMWNKFVEEFVEELLPTLSTVNSTIVRAARAMVHEMFNKEYNDYPHLSDKKLEEICDAIHLLVKRYNLYVAFSYEKLPVQKKLN